MQTYTRRSRIQSLKAELELRRKTCTALKREFEKHELSNDERMDLFRRWSDTLKESQLLQSLLDMLERLEKEAAHYSDEAEQAFQGAQHVAAITFFFHGHD